jgi:transketolase
MTPGIETTTGPLGQGVANAVGMAIAERFLAKRFNRDGFPVLDHHTWAVAGDGCLMEGLTYEAVSLAGHLQLGRLNVLYDDNEISIDGSTDITFTEDVDMRFRAAGWHVLVVDGHDADAVDEALNAARQETTRPTLVRCITHIGHGAPTKQDSSAAHGAPLGDEEIAGAKEAMGWPAAPFHVPADVQDWMEDRRGQWANDHREWDDMMGRYREAHPTLSAEFDACMHGELPANWDANLPHFEAGSKMATRKASGAVLNALAESLTTLIGGSADLEGSNNSKIAADGHMTPENLGERNIHFGVREHAMGAICNGMSLHGGTLPFCATFLQFADYMRPSVRLAALMEVQVVYVWTHDSIFLGEDGPTHQPVEHLAALRVIPNLEVFRPADANETAWCWAAAIARRDGPSALALTRQSLPNLAITATDGRKGVEQGGYVVHSQTGDAPEDIALLATGSEVSLALDAATDLLDHGIRARVISVPCRERFLALDAATRDAILPGDVPVRMVVEAGRRQGWEPLLGPFSGAVTIETFGHSAPADDLAREYGFTRENVVSEALRALEAFKTSGPEFLARTAAALDRAGA